MALRHPMAGGGHEAPVSRASPARSSSGCVETLRAPAGGAAGREQDLMDLPERRLESETGADPFSPCPIGARTFETSTRRPAHARAPLQLEHAQVRERGLRASICDESTVPCGRRASEQVRIRSG